MGREHEREGGHMREYCTLQRLYNNRNGKVVYTNVPGIARQSAILCSDGDLEKHYDVHIFLRCTWFVEDKCKVT